MIGYRKLSMRYALLLTLALFAGAVGCGRSPAPDKTMSYTLDICGDKKIENPTEAEIRQAVLALDTTKNEAFLVLGSTDMTYIQTGGDQKVGFDLEYQESDVRHHYRAKRDFTAEEIVRILVSYAAGTDNWKKSAEWEPIEL